MGTLRSRREVVLDALQLELPVGKRAVWGVRHGIATAAEVARAEPLVRAQRSRPALGREGLSVGRCTRAVVRLEVDELARIVEKQPGAYRVRASPYELICSASKVIHGAFALLRIRPRQRARRSTMRGCPTEPVTRK